MGMTEDFLKLTPAGQVKFLKTEEFAQMEKAKRVEFLKEIAVSDGISSKCLASALKILRELKFRERSFYKRFLDHPDSSVTMACKKALSDRDNSNGCGFFPMRELVKKQNNEKKLETVKLIVSETGRAGEILFVGFDAIQEAIEALQNGDMLATIAQRPGEIGRLGVETAVKYLSGETVPESILVDLALIIR